MLNELKKDKIRLLLYLIIVMEIIILICLTVYRVNEFKSSNKEVVKDEQNKDNLKDEENDLNNEKEENNKDTNNNGTDNNEINNSELNELDINSDLVKNLISPFTRVPDMLNSYYLKDTFELAKSNPSILNSLSLQYGIYSERFETLKPNLNSSDGTYYTINTDNFEELFKEIFGPDMAFQHSNFKFTPRCLDYGDKEQFNKSLDKFDVLYDASNNLYTKIVPGNCGSKFSYSTYTPVKKVFKAESLDNIISVYSYMFYYGSTIDNTLNKGIQLELNTNFDKPTPCHITSWLGDVIYDSQNALCELNILEEFKKQNKLPIYKATYKKQSDGNYYFTKGEWQ